MTPVAAAHLENDAGGMAHVHVEDDRRPLCFHRKFVTADSSTLPTSVTLPNEGALCRVCRAVLEGAGGGDLSNFREIPPREQSRVPDTYRH